MRIQAVLCLKVIDLKTGRTITTRRVKSRSYVKAFIDLHYRFRTSTSWPVIDINGISRDNTPDTQDWRMDHDSAWEPHGIIVGTGTTAVAIGDYALETMIADGSGAGELVHQDTQFIPPSTVGTRRRFFITRTFLNQSGGAITINEAGLYTWGGGTGQGFCIIRDTIIPGETVPNNSSITAQYEIFAEA